MKIGEYRKSGRSLKRFAVVLSAWIMAIAPSIRGLNKVNGKCKEKIRYCFFKTYQAKMAICVPASAAAQYAWASIKRRYNNPDNESLLYCQH